MALSDKARAKIYRARNADKVRAKDAERKRKSRLKTVEQDKNPIWPTDPAKAVSDWAAETLVIPPGHPNEGQAFILPSYGVSFLQDALSVDCNEACLLVARKNSKSRHYRLPSDSLPRWSIAAAGLEGWRGVSEQRRRPPN